MVKDRHRNREARATKWLRELKAREGQHQGFQKKKHIDCRLLPLFPSSRVTPTYYAHAPPHNDLSSGPWSTVLVYLLQLCCHFTPLTEIRWMMLSSIPFIQIHLKYFHKALPEPMGPYSPSAAHKPKSSVSFTSTRERNGIPSRKRILFPRKIMTLGLRIW